MRLCACVLYSVCVCEYKCVFDRINAQICLLACKGVNFLPLTPHTPAPFQHPTPILDILFLMWISFACVIACIYNKDDNIHK